jgi:predicted membrane-bound spermidine synthase
LAGTARDRWYLFLCSFTILYVELVCIRWIPSYVRALGFFTNFVLLGSFLGIGLGILQARRRFDFVTLFPALLAVLVAAVTTFRIELSVSTAPNETFYGIVTHGTDAFYVVPLIFLVVTVLFTLLGQQLGRQLAAVRPPLLAYTIDIAGSIAGTLLFTLVSFLNTQPGVWFALGALLVLLYPVRLRHSRAIRTVNAVLLLGMVIWIGLLGSRSLWSPYYRVDQQRLSDGSTQLFVNNIGHQVMAPYALRVRRSPVYLVPFRTFHFPASTRELIIGAGSGSDADIAVHNGIRNVTGVEIDPTIYNLGKTENPDHIYQNPHVHVIVDDGRSFLEKTHGTYDLIIFALPDSLALTSSFANLRLESYLFTRESFAAAKRHLSPNGVLVLYNYYRQRYIVDKIAGMLQDVFGQAPYGHIVSEQSNGAVLMDGPRLREIPAADYAAHRFTGKPDVAPATDDWPFLYLKDHELSPVYLQAIGLVWLIALAGLGLSLGRDGLRRLRGFDTALFCTGLAFLLLEAKSIVNFSLLFGSTWLVNALVIIGILLMVQLANWVNALTRLRLDIRLLYLGLAATLALNLLLPFNTLLVDNLALRYALGCAVLLSPILLANLIFGRIFGQTDAPDLALAANLLGAFIGGTLEYASLQTGYHLLLVPVTIAYLLSFVAVARRLGRVSIAGRLAAAR